MKLFRSFSSFASRIRRLRYYNILYHPQQSRNKSISSSTNSTLYLMIIPIELWRKILVFLPVKNLLILRAVCKFFLSIIDDSDFVFFHLRNFPNNVHGTRYLTLCESSGRVLHRIHKISKNCMEPVKLDKFRRDTLLQKLIGFMLRCFTIDERCWNLEGSVDGLALFVSTYRPDGYPIVVLFNRSVMKSRQLSLPSSRINQFGFGYHHSCKDYKIVAMCVERDQAWIYSVKTGSWTEILNSGFHCRVSEADNRHYKFSDKLSSTYGILFIENLESRIDSLVWFDFGTEKFRYTNDKPFERPYRNFSLMSLDGGSSVGAWVVDFENRVCVWALDINTLSWTRRYEFARDLLPGELLKDVKEIRFFERNGELVWEYLQLIDRSLVALTFDLTTKVIKRRHEFSATKAIKLCGENISEVIVYVESLIMVM